MAAKDGERTLDQTPTWAVAGVCAVIILISLILEKVLHKAGTWLTDRHKRALYEALEKVKAELMILGFISLTLVFSQYYIAEICIPASVGNTMLPCRAESSQDNAKEEHRRRLLSYDRRVLAAKSAPVCGEGKVALITVDGLHQIHILIFFLAVFHVIYSAITMALGRLKIRGWKQWEQETLSHDYEFSNDPSRFRLTHETSFVRSVNKSDYMTLRNGFISVHLAPGSKFNFQKYIKRSLEDDFKTVVGLILAVGTKLQAILTKMALEITERHAVVQGIPLVQGSDKYFWFGRPQLVLHLIHFALFQNAFQVTYFLWIWYEFGLKSCFHDNFGLIIAKIALGVGVLFLCSYITLPLYALIAQMGSNMKKSIFDEQTSKALKKWHMAVKKKHGGRAGRSPTRTLGGGSPTSSMGSPFHPTAATLHRFKTTGHSARSSGFDDHDASDLEDPSTPPKQTTSLIIRSDPVDHHDDPHLDVENDIGLVRNGEETRNEDDFSFVKPAIQNRKCEATRQRHLLQTDLGALLHSVAKRFQTGNIDPVKNLIDTLNKNAPGQGRLTGNSDVDDNE
ncbi:hypothetical protein DH2020_013689 [Rehmannia glutinosa]|uniref:MLO-like protein n=1 Tax=Rehmannia glutinosa TaxID=99300 RepID=A0ABR0X6P7_REHGL